MDPTAAADKTTRQDPLAILEGLPDVVERILYQLELKDLRNCAQVCKRWNYLASVAVDGGTSTLNLRDGCGSIAEFSEILKYPHLSLINSLDIDLKVDHECDYFSPGEWKSSLAKICRLRLRCLRLFTGPCRSMHRVAGYLILGSATTLEELHLTYKRHLGECEAESVLKWKAAIRFPRLKHIEVGPPFCNPWLELRNFILASPRLEAVTGLVSLDDSRELGRELLRVLTAVNCFPLKGTEEALVSLVQSRPKLVELQFYDGNTRIIPQSWSEHLRRLLWQCSDTLKRVSACASLFLEFGKNRGLCLQQLQSLELFFPEDADTEYLSAILASINLTTACAKVTALRLTFTEDCIHPATEITCENNEIEDLAPSITEVTLMDPPCTVAGMITCVRAFPHITSFAVEVVACAELCGNGNPQHAYDMSLIWRDLPCLERLKICLTDDDRMPQGFLLDAVLCGITLEETELLKKGYRAKSMNLSLWQYCPIRPSIAHAQRLKELQVILARGYTCDGFDLSEVTAYLAIMRLPQLRVSIESHCTAIADELRSLESFFKIRYVTDGRDWL